MRVRYFVALVQAAEGYPAPGDPLEPAPPDGPFAPTLHSVVLAEDFERLQRAVDTAHSALRGSEYVGDPSGRAWRTAVEALGEVATQHQAQMETGS